MAQADTDKKLEEKFKAANQKLEEIQKVLIALMGPALEFCSYS